MKEYAKAFYNSKAWKKLSRLYMTMKNYVCERCGKPGDICHHKQYITVENIHDANITLNLDNLECLCKECHNKEHFCKDTKIIFDEHGQAIGINESQDLKEYKKDINNIKGLVSDFKEKNNELYTETKRMQ